MYVIIYIVFNYFVLKFRDPETRKTYVTKIRDPCWYYFCTLLFLTILCTTNKTFQTSIINFLKVLNIKRTNVSPMAFWNIFPVLNKMLFIKLNNIYICIKETLFRSRNVVEQNPEISGFTNGFCILTYGTYFYHSCICICAHLHLAFGRHLTSIEISQLESMSPFACFPTILPCCFRKRLFAATAHANVRTHNSRINTRINMSGGVLASNGYSGFDIPLPQIELDVAVILAVDCVLGQSSAHIFIHSYIKM